MIFACHQSLNILAFHKRVKWYWGRKGLKTIRFSSSFFPFFLSFPIFRPHYIFARSCHYSCMTPGTYTIGQKNNETTSSLRRARQRKDRPEDRRRWSKECYYRFSLHSSCYCFMRGLMPPRLRGTLVWGLRDTMNFITTPKMLTSTRTGRMLRNTSSKLSATTGTKELWEWNAGCSVGKSSGKARRRV